ncbi:MAG: membrane protein insertase YidC, partial [Aureliella sp.]
YHGDATDNVAADADAYTLDYETVVENHSEKAVDLSLRHEALAGITLEGWWYSVKVSPYFFRGAGQRDIRFGDAAGNNSIVLARSIYDRELKNPRDQGLFVDAGGTPAARSLRYVGLDTQYFAAAFLPHAEQPDALSNLHQAGSEAIANVNMMVSSQSQAVNTAFWFDTSPSSVAPGGSLSTRYRIFAGPKDTKILSHFGLERFIEYGWLEWITKPLSWVLYFFYGIVRNYGIAIIMLTLLVRGCMFPLGRQAAVNAQKMQELQPEMKRINDLYKEDMQKRAEATRELYSKHNFRPLASCLPMFVQIPVFMALYRCLSVDISLRQEPLIPGLSWASNLAGPDMLFDWSSWMPEIIAGRGTGYLGPYFNILPVITVSLFLVQQKILMPKATDEQTQMTQTMMQWMTVFMGVLFFKVPSGLCIYFITSSLWSLAERKLVKRLVPAKAPAAAAAATPAPRPAPPTRPADRKAKEAPAPRPQSGMAARLAELREMLDKPAVRSATQRRDPDKNKKRKR